MWREASRERSPPPALPAANTGCVRAMHKQLRDTSASAGTEEWSRHSTARCTTAQRHLRVFTPAGSMWLGGEPPPAAAVAAATAEGGAAWRRSAMLASRQEEYDRIAASAARHTAPKPDPHEAFQAHLRRLSAEQVWVARLTANLELREAAREQRAHARHHEWVTKVYDPIASKLAAAVDSAYTRRVHERRTAYDAYLRAAAAPAGVFLHDMVTPASYDPYRPNAGAVRVIATREAAADPLVQPLVRRQEEDAAMRTGRAALARTAEHAAGRSLLLMSDGLGDARPTARVGSIAGSEARRRARSACHAGCKPRDR